MIYLFRNPFRLIPCSRSVYLPGCHSWVWNHHHNVWWYTCIFPFMFFVQRQSVFLLVLDLWNDYFTCFSCWWLLDDKVMIYLDFFLYWMKSFLFLEQQVVECKSLNERLHLHCKYCVTWWICKYVFKQPSAHTDCNSVPNEMYRKYVHEMGLHILCTLTVIHSSKIIYTTRTSTISGG